MRRNGEERMHHRQIETEVGNRGGVYRKEEILQEKDTGRSSCKGEKMQNDRNAATEK